MTTPKMAATPQMGNLQSGDSNESPFRVRSKQSDIQWPTKREIGEVSTRLARVLQVGICLESNREYSKSGDLAYQLQEIIRSTAELLKQSKRAKGKDPAAV